MKPFDPIDAEKDAPAALMHAISEGDAKHFATKFDIYDQKFLSPSALAALLMRAATDSNVECVEFLLARGADCSRVDYKGNTALHCAVSMVWGQKMVECVKLLIPHADARALNSWGQSPLWRLLTRAQTIVSRMRDEGEAQDASRDQDDEVSAAVAAILAPLSDCEARGPQGITLLGAAADLNSTRLLRVLLPFCDPRQTDGDGSTRNGLTLALTPLMHAVDRGCLAAARALAPMSDEALPAAKGFSSLRRREPTALENAIELALKMPEGKKRTK